MQLHEIKQKNKRSAKKRVGRGGSRGTYSGKGMKGQKSRAGRRIRPHLRDIIKKLPKRRGYNSPVIGEKPQVINIGSLEKIFKDSDVITPKLLVEKKLVKMRSGKTPKVKVLALGKLTKKLTIQNCLVSESAKKEIEKAGGEVK